jgi:poly-beta-hydroxyalkanoate depolymerase
MLLYQAYQAQCDALAPMRLFADSARSLLSQPWFGTSSLVRGAWAALSLFSDSRLSHDRPAFGIERVMVDGAETAVTEEAVAVHRLPSGALPKGAPDQPKLLMVAPPSAISRPRCAAGGDRAAGHDVYLTDWTMPVPVQHGRSDLDDMID